MIKVLFATLMKCLWNKCTVCGKSGETICCSEDSHCTCNVTLRHVLATIVSVEKQ